MFVNEYNYMQEFASRLQHELMPKLLRSHVIDWSALFLKYDNNNNGLISRFEIAEMMKDCGMGHSTNAEIEFTFNIISKFHEKLNAKTFIAWAKSMEGQS
jgi:Ca2+-binding EF-hand superfamily protein